MLYTGAPVLFAIAVPALTERTRDPSETKHIIHKEKVLTFEIKTAIPTVPTLFYYINLHVLCWRTQII